MANRVEYHICKVLTLEETPVDCRIVSINSKVKLVKFPCV